MIIDIQFGDIFNIECDAIVNPTDRHFSAGGGIDRVIRLKGGQAMTDELAAETKKVKKINEGDCFCTKARDLKSSYVLHTVTPVFRPDDAERSFTTLKECCQKIYSAASANREIRHIAMPAIGTGKGGYPVVDHYYGGKLQDVGIRIISGPCMGAEISGKHDQGRENNCAEVCLRCDRQPHGERAVPLLPERNAVLQA